MQAKQIRNKKKLTLITATLLIILIAAMFSVNASFAVKPGTVPVLLDPKTIPKYVNQLVVPPVYTPDDVGGTTYTVSMVTDRQQILPTLAQGMILPVPGDGLTNVWGYQGDAIAKGATLGVADGTDLPDFVFSPSSTFEAVKNVPITVNWVNQINVPQPFAVDPTLQWANPRDDFPDGDIFSTLGGPFEPFPFGYDGIVRPNNPDALNAQSPVALVPHLHGAEVASEYDGGPEAWWTAADTNGLGLNFKGPNYRTSYDAGQGTAVYEYPNAQEPNTLWYHDHALGITRINVMSGLAGFYLLRDPGPWDGTTPLTATNLDEYLTQTFEYGISEIPIAIQDRTFKANGELWFPEVGLDPSVHPYWMPEFFGDTIMVNGMVWPNLDVTPGWYRFRLLDGSNARFYDITLKDQITGLKIPFIQIGADGGYLQSPVPLKSLLIAPGERADILVDFSAIAPGTTIIVENKAKAPFPNGAQPNPQTTGQIMQITVKAKTDPTWINEVEGVTNLAVLPAMLNPTLTVPAVQVPQFPTLPSASVTNTRYITLNEVMGALGPVMVMINGQYFRAEVTEDPIEGSTEEWVIINLTADTHPIHLHLVTFQLVSRQPFDTTNYNTAWIQAQANDETTNLPYVPPFPEHYLPTPLNPLAYYKGKAILPTPTEMTWKDTLQMNPGEVTTIRVKFTSQDETAFPPEWFSDPNAPGYVYHCHIIDHEDNEMMRPFKVIPAV